MLRKIVLKAEMWNAEKCQKRKVRTRLFFFTYWYLRTCCIRQRIWFEYKLSAPMHGRLGSKVHVVWVIFHKKCHQNSILFIKSRTFLHVSGLILTFFCTFECHSKCWFASQNQGSWIGAVSFFFVILESCLQIVSNRGDNVIVFTSKQRKNGTLFISTPQSTIRFAPSDFNYQNKSTWKAWRNIE